MAGLFSITILFCSGKRILGRVQHPLRLVEVDFIQLHADVLEHLVQSFSIMTEGHGAVVRIVLLDEHMAVETSHLRNGENTDAAKGTGCNGKHLALRDIRTKLAVRRALQAVEGDGTRNNVSSRVPWVTSSGRLLAMMN